MANDIKFPDGLNKVSDSTMNNLSKVIDEFDSYIQSSKKALSSFIKTIKESSEINEKNTKATKDTVDVLKNKIKNDKSIKGNGKSNSKGGGGKDSNTLFTTFKNDMMGVLKDNKESIKGSLLGPLNLIFEPFKGILGPFIKLIGGGLGKIFKIGHKNKPSENDVAKAGPLGIGALFIGNMIKSIFGKKGKDKDGGLFGEGGLLGKLGSGIKSLFKGGLGKGLVKMGGIAMLASGLIMGAVDGINGWIKSQDWGTSKVSGFLGGFMAGTGKGSKNAFKNAGKWALMGAGAGTLIAPPLGTIVGGLAGAAVGGLMGYFGGEAMAKGIDEVFNVSKFQKIWKDNSTKTSDKIGLTILEGAKTAITAPFKLLGKAGKAMGEGISKLADYVKENTKDMQEAYARGGWSEAVKVGFTKIKNKITDFLENTPVGQWLNDNIVKPIKRFFNRLGELSGYLASTGFEGLKKLFDRNSLGISEFDALMNAKELADEDMLYKSAIQYAKIKNFSKTRDDDFTRNYLIASKGLEERLQSEDFRSSSAFDQSVKMKVYLEEISNRYGSVVADEVKNALMNRTSYEKALELLEEGNENTSEIATNTEEEAQSFTAQTQTGFQVAYKVKDAIIRPDGSVIQTDPKDTLVALKDIPFSMSQIQAELEKNKNQSLNSINGGNGTIENKLNTIADLLNRLLSKDVQVNLPQQTRYDLDIVMSGGMV